MIRLASSFPSRCAAAFKLAMCCESAAALAGADEGVVEVAFTLAGVGFFFVGIEVDGVGFDRAAAEAVAAEREACLSLVLTEATKLPESLTPFSWLIC